MRVDNCPECRVKVNKIRELEAKVERLERALRRIADQDYRGPRPWDSQLAYEALQEGEQDGDVLLSEL